MNKNICVISAGMVHPNLMCQYNLRQLLNGRKEYVCRFTTKLSNLINLSTDETSTVILYFQKKEISDPHLEALESFVFNGGSLLALHSASASFKKNKRYFNLIGGRFIRHGKISDYKIEVVKTKNDIYSGIQDFTVTDELYMHEYLKDVTIHFSTQVGNKNEPVVWTRELGKGKIAYCSLGHQASVLKHPSVISIIYQSLDWLEVQ